MRTIKYIFLAIIGSLVFTACEKYEFLNLERDNPLDGTKKAQITFDSFVITNDTNGDKIVNIGETVELKVTLKNNGLISGTGIKAAFSTTSQDVTGFAMYQNKTEISYGYIMAGYKTSSDSYYDLQFKVSNTAADGTQIPINISISDESGNTWTASFSVTVYASGAKIEFVSYSIYYDNNGDKIINKGEKIQMMVGLKNTGTSTAKAVKAVFSTTSQDVSGFAMYLNASEMSYGDLLAGGTKSSSSYYYDIQFTVSNTAAAGTQIPINISITDESNNTWTGSFNVNVQ